MDYIKGLTLPSHSSSFRVSFSLRFLRTTAPPTFFTYNDQKLIDNTPNYNIAWMISVEKMEVLGQNQTSSNSTILYVLGGVAAAIVIGGVGAAVVFRKRKLRESRKEED